MKQTHDPMKKLSLVILILIAFAMAMPECSSAAGLDDQEIKFSSILNARDMGGYKTRYGKTVKRGVLLRSGELSYATKGDMKKLKNEYDLKMVFDFRFGTDARYCPDKRVSGVRYINMPAAYSRHPSKKSPKKRYKRFKGKSARKLRSKAIPTFGKADRNFTYTLVMGSHSKKTYRKYFKYLLANKSGKSVLIHCIYGKDRTGVAAFMTLVALGVDEKTAYKDYAMTNSYLKKYGKKTYNRGHIGVRTKDLKYAVGKAKKKYGSLNRFLYKAYGLDSKKLKKLRSIYTE